MAGSTSSIMEPESASGYMPVSSASQMMIKTHKTMASPTRRNHDLETASTTEEDPVESDLYSMATSDVVYRHLSFSASFPREGGQESREITPTQPDGRGIGRRGLCACLPLRFVVMGMVFVGMVIISAMRTNVGVTVLTILGKDPHAGPSNKTRTKVPDVDWDAIDIGFLHSAFYVGYTLTHLPAGYLTTRIPSHKLFALCLLVSSLLNLCVPVAIQMGGYFVAITIRFAQGLDEGLLYPACYGILRHWSTPPERGRVGALVLTGAHLGPAVFFPVAGAITEHLGWDYVYYVNGGVCVLYVAAWMWLSEEKPSHHKQISEEELNFIEELQGSEKIDYKDMRIPWGQIMMSLPVLSLCLCHFARNWVYVLGLTNQPLFLSLFHFTITENGLYSSLPHVFKICSALVSGVLADCFLGYYVMSTTNTRKFLTTGFLVQALMFFLLTRTSQGSVAMPLLTMAIGFGGFAVSGWQLNHYDLSARHASVLVAVTSTFGNLASISAPIVIGIMTQMQTIEGWYQVFIITAGILGLAWLCFLVVGTGERQPWAAPAVDCSVTVEATTRCRLSNPLPQGAGVASPPSAYSSLHEAGGHGHVTLSHESGHVSD